jgi:hypothetical protein
MIGTPPRLHRDRAPHICTGTGLPTSALGLTRLSQAAIDAKLVALVAASVNAPTDVFAKPAATGAIAAEQRLLAAIGIAAGESGLVTNGRVLLLRSREDGSYARRSKVINRRRISHFLFENDCWALAAVLGADDWRLLEQYETAARVAFVEEVISEVIACGSNSL